MAFITITIISLTSIYAPCLLRRIHLLVGMMIGYLFYVGCELTRGPAIDYTGVDEARWFAALRFTKPVFEDQAISVIVPVCAVLLAENLGHIKAMSAVAEQLLDRYLGRALLGDVNATVMSTHPSARVSRCTVKTLA